MASIRSLFSFPHSSKEDQEKFISFLNKNVSEFFSDVGSARYEVPYLMVQSTINEGRRNFKGAKHRRVWLILSNAISFEQANSKYSTMHKAEIFKIIHEQAQGSYQRMMNLIQKFINDFENEDLQFNVVKYTYLDNFSKTGGFIK